MRAVVFAYHNVGARALRTLLAGGMQVELVLTHPDDPGETIWFESVAAVAAEHGIPVALVDLSVPPELQARVAAIHPDYLFSFYFRRMLPPALLATARIAALNMHGSLLPKYRGRVPVNWAVLHGERETGATLHVMEAKPDAGDIVAQQAVPILPDDTAKDVFDKVTVAAEIALWSVLPQLMRGQLPRRPNPLAQGSYFGGRKPEDGRLDWTRPAAELYNLIRAVAPPYPGAFFESGARRLIVARARLARPEIAALLPESCGLGLHAVAGKLLARAGDGGVIHILELWDAGFPGTPLSPQQVSELAAHLP
ncbi:bifunctional polymyxin resistance protein ArnA [mine drainage metagenome]|uniref:Bifunctional polymyxin resistance protein ArnA n=1 Tax=mine drainage metagenome TaxID=410659 RepID=A0A1J5QPQ2_9ZZZZ